MVVWTWSLGDFETLSSVLIAARMFSPEAKDDGPTKDGGEPKAGPTIVEKN